MSANLLAKVASGLCDDLLGSVIRAWDTEGTIDGTINGQRKRIIVCCAMNTAMYKHPATAKHIKTLEEDWGVDAPGGWFEVLRPQEKLLACGDAGVGAMLEWTEIVKVISTRLNLPSIP
jgi:phosphopantothenoylcysteine decarboxylase